MKKSCLIAVIATLAAVAGALAAVAVYLHRREKELDEYERLLCRRAARRRSFCRGCRRINQTPKNAPGLSLQAVVRFFIRRID